MTRPEQPEFRLCFRALPDEVPPIIRLRRLLKTALRYYKMRCTNAVEFEAEVKPADVTGSDCNADTAGKVDHAESTTGR